MAETPQAAARAAGLRYVTPGEPGFRRVRAGAGFAYLRADGARLVDRRHLERIATLAIPPAWTEVWICATWRGHVQVTARDAKGRKQYRYHPAWRRIRDRTKYEDLARFAACLPRLRKRIELDVKGAAMTKTKVVATAVKVLESTRIRVGNDCYAEENGSYGVTTLLDRHVRVSRDRVEFRFRGKSGVVGRAAVHDRRTARLVKECRDVRGPRLFQYVDPDGRRRKVTAADVNAYMRAAMASDFTAKVVRTWSATVSAAQLLYAAEPPRSERHAKAEVRRAIAGVAARLGNTPAVCRDSYVHPVVIDAYRDGTLHRHFGRCRAGAARAKREGLLPEECAVLALFDRIEHARRAA